MNGQVGAVRDHVAKVVVVDYFMKQGIKTTMVVLVMVLVNITKTATPTAVQVSVELLIYSISMHDYVKVHCVANVYAVLSVSTVKCQCSGGRE